MIFWMSCVELDSNPSCWMGRGIKGKTIIKVLVFGVGIHVKIRLAIGFFVVFQYDQKQVVSSVSFSRLSWAWCSLSSCGFESACGSPDPISVSAELLGGCSARVFKGLLDSLAHISPRIFTAELLSPIGVVTL